MNTPAWIAILSLAGIVLMIIPFICMYLLAFKWAALSNKARWHCIVGILFY